MKRTGDTPVENPVTADGTYDPSAGGYNVTETKKTGGWDGFVTGVGDFFKGLGDAFNSTVGFGGDWMLAANTIKECEARAERCLVREYPKEDQCTYNVTVWNNWLAALEEYRMRLGIVQEGFKNYKLDGLALGLMGVYKGAAHVPNSKESAFFGAVAGVTESVCEIFGINKFVQKNIFKADVNVRADALSVTAGIAGGAKEVVEGVAAGSVEAYMKGNAKTGAALKQAQTGTKAISKSEEAFRALVDNFSLKNGSKANTKLLTDYLREVGILPKNAAKAVQPVGQGATAAKSGGKILGKVAGWGVDAAVLYCDAKAVGDCGSLAAQTGEILRSDLVSLRVAANRLEVAYDCLYDSCQKKKKDPNETKDEDDSETPKSCDPNEIVGPAGVGERRYVKPGEWMEYTVYFENVSNATAAAQEIRVTSQLSPYLDWSTFEMGEVAFDNQSELGLAGTTGDKLPQ